MQYRYLAAVVAEEAVIADRVVVADKELADMAAAVGIAVVALLDTAVVVVVGKEAGHNSWIAAEGVVDLVAVGDKPAVPAVD